MIVLGLGTNLGNREEQLRRAVTALKPLLADLTCSPVYESSALLPENAAQEWDRAFLNMAVAGTTTLTPRALLAELKTLERSLGRTPRAHWGPREIDIDILAYGDETLSEPDLIIPHAALLERDFALIPFADIAPLWHHPVAGKTARALAVQITSTLTGTDIVIA